MNIYDLDIRQVLIFKFEILQVMHSEEICQLIHQILPELQTKIKAELEEQFEQRLLVMQSKYQAQATNIITQQEQDLRKQYQERLAEMQNLSQPLVSKEEQQLIRRVSLLQNQRKNWYTLEKQYEQTINKLLTKLMQYEDTLDGNSKDTSKLAMDEDCTPLISARSQHSHLNLLTRNKKGNNNKNTDEIKNICNQIDSISPIALESEKLLKSFKVSQWECTISQKNKNNRRSRQTLAQSNQISSSKPTQIAEIDRNQSQKHKDFIRKREAHDIPTNTFQNQLHEGEEQTTHQKQFEEYQASNSQYNEGNYQSKYTQKNKQNNDENSGDYPNKNHYRSILSPPRNQIHDVTDYQRKDNENGVKKKSTSNIFWNEQKKKHLLSLIKLN